MKNKNAYTHLFVEIILVVFFISIVAAIVLNVYSKTDRYMSLSEYESKAALTAQTIISNYKMDNDIKKAINATFKDVTIEKNGENVYEINLDRDFECDANDIKVVLKIDTQPDVDIIELHYYQKVFDCKSSIYNIEAAAIKRDGGNNEK